MRFLGLVVAIVGAVVIYFLGYRGMTVDQMRTRLAQLTNLPGLAPPGAAVTPVSGTMTQVAAVSTSRPGAGGLGFTGRGRQT